MNWSRSPFVTQLIATLEVGERYTHRHLEQLLGWESGAALRKGVLSKSGEEAILLLINLEKKKGATPYRDHIDNDILYWEGQLHNRFVEERFQDPKYEYFIFIREFSEERDWRYYGRALPLATQFFAPGTPCRTKFILYEWAESPFYTSYSVNDLQSDTPHNLRTTRMGIVEQRSVQSQYRQRALALWKGRCAVLGIEEPKILIASHIKPWRASSDQERLDPKNSLILSPLYDKLFDLGMISFRASDGSIQLSKQLTSSEYEHLGIDDTKHLSFIPSGTEAYLSYHQLYVFDFKAHQESVITQLIR